MDQGRLNMAIEKKTQISVNLGTELMLKLDAYCALTKKNRSDIIRTLIVNLPQKDALPELSGKSLLNDSIYLNRLARFLLIAKTVISSNELKKEAQELWQSLVQFLK